MDRSPSHSKTIVLWIYFVWIRWKTSDKLAENQQKFRCFRFFALQANLGVEQVDAARISIGLKHIPPRVYFTCVHFFLHINAWMSCWFENARLTGYFPLGVPTDFRGQICSTSTWSGAHINLCVCHPKGSDPPRLVAINRGVLQKTYQMNGCFLRILQTKW